MPSPFRKACLDLYSRLEDYFIGPDLSRLGSNGVKAKANGSAIRFLLETGRIIRIEVTENRFVYKKADIPADHAALVRKTDQLKEVRTDYVRRRTKATRETSDITGTAVAPAANDAWKGIRS